MTGPEFCTAEQEFNQAACACFLINRCDIGCLPPFGNNNPLVNCQCISDMDFMSITDHGLDENCKPIEEPSSSSDSDSDCDCHHHHSCCCHDPCDDPCDSDHGSGGSTVGCPEGFTLNEALNVCVRDLATADDTIEHHHDIQFYDNDEELSREISIAT